MELTPSAQRVQAFMVEKGFPFIVKEFSSSTRTSQDAADSIGCLLSQIAKSLIFKDKDSGKPVLIIASGSHRVSVKKVKAATGLRLTKADGNFVKEETGYAIGGIPPAGHLSPLTTFMDESLLKHEIIWGAAGTPHAVFQLTPKGLESLTGGLWIDLAEEK